MPPRKRRPWSKLWETWFTSPSHANFSATTHGVGVRCMSFANSQGWDKDGTGWVTSGDTRDGPRDDERDVERDAPRDDDRDMERDSRSAIAPRRDSHGARHASSNAPRNGGRPLTVAAIARLSNATLEQTEEALREIVEAGTMIRRADGAYGFPNLETWQDTPEAERQRRSRMRRAAERVTPERDAPRDVERDAPRDDDRDSQPDRHASSNAPVTRRGERIEEKNKSAAAAASDARATRLELVEIPDYDPVELPGPGGGGGGNGLDGHPDSDIPFSDGPPEESTGAQEPPAEGPADAIQVRDIYNDVCGRTFAPATGVIRSERKRRVAEISQPPSWWRVFFTQAERQQYLRRTYGEPGRHYGLDWFLEEQHMTDVLEDKWLIDHGARKPPKPAFEPIRPYVPVAVQPPVFKAQPISTEEQERLRALGGQKAREVLKSLPGGSR